jgi:hypothetical protein
MKAAGVGEPALTARNVVSTRTDARASVTGRPHALRFAAGLATAALTGGLLVAVNIGSVIGWSLEGGAPASGWLGIAMGVVVGGILGGIGDGIQRRASIPRIVAPHRTAPHRVNLVTKGPRGCSASGNVSLSSNTIVSSSRLSVDAGGKLKIDGTVDVNGKVAAGCFAGSGVGLI